MSYAVQSGNADYGLGIMSAAKAYDLGFVPIKEESFDIVIPENIINEKHIQILIEIINSKEFKNSINKIGGYSTSKTGQEIK